MIAERGIFTKYENTYQGIFIERPNRFIARVMIDGKEETVHVKNTGRCRELLLPGVRVILQKSSNPSRKTAFDLISVFKNHAGWINIDSSAPNKAAAEWLAKQDFTLIKPEFGYGKSRVDFYMERGNEKYLLEIKGCTLESEGIGYFPDAPTQRGSKHLNELAAAGKQGFNCAVGFVIAINNVKQVIPNTKTDPIFSEALEAAKKSGVKVIYYRCRVTENELEIVEEAEG